MRAEGGWMEKATFRGGRFHLKINDNQLFLDKLSNACMSSTNALMIQIEIYY